VSTGGGAPWEWRSAARPYTVGAEEELMILDGETLGLAGDSARVMAALPDDLRARVTTETHAGALEIATGVHETAGAAVDELRALRAGISSRLAELGLRAASAGTHPLALGLATALSDEPRYRHLHEDMGELIRREPTFGLHVHVGLPDRDVAIRAFDRMRIWVPLLIGLAANSPFWRARDSGLGCSRTFVFDAFPRTGLPRAFGGYAAYAEAVDALISAGAIEDPSFIWWDLRLKPDLGTIEIRAMDAQRTVGDAAALIALVQCLVRRCAEEPAPRVEPPPEVLAENRFLAMRDGPRAELIDGRARERLALILERVLEDCRPHARELGCAEELAGVEELVLCGGAAYQREAARLMGVEGVPTALADCYTGGCSP
jgi:carboxylate-amine ligase